MLDERIITKLIVQGYLEEFLRDIESDVAIAGAGPAGLVAGAYLAQAGFKTVLFERTLSVGGGVWGGGMMYNKIVVQEKGRAILEEFGIRYEEKEKGYFLAGSIETVAKLTAAALTRGASIYNLVSVEDLIVKKGRVEGLVLSWTATQIAKLHVDPLAVKSRYVIDATGHACELAHLAAKKSGSKLFTETGDVMGEKSLDAAIGEETVVENTKEIFPCLYVAGMAANAVFAGPRMGPVFGGMLISGVRAAEIILEKLKNIQAHN